MVVRDLQLFFAAVIVLCLIILWRWWYSSPLGPGGRNTYGITNITWFDGNTPPLGLPSYSDSKEIWSKGLVLTLDRSPPNITNETQKATFSLKSGKGFYGVQNKIFATDTDNPLTDQNITDIYEEVLKNINNTLVGEINPANPSVKLYVSPDNDPPARKNNTNTSLFENSWSINMMTQQNIFGGTETTATLTLSSSTSQ